VQISTAQNPRKFVPTLASTTVVKVDTSIWIWSEMEFSHNTLCVLQSRHIQKQSMWNDCWKIIAFIQDYLLYCKHGSLYTFWCKNVNSFCFYFRSEFLLSFFQKVLFLFYLHSFEIVLRLRQGINVVFVYWASTINARSL